MVVLNAAASAVTTRSPYVTRISYTIAQSAKPLAGIYSSGFYSSTRGGPENAAFLDAFARTVNGKFKPGFLAAASYDGMALIHKTLKKTNGNADGNVFMEAV